MILRLLDTNICIYIINRKPAGPLKCLVGCTPGDVAISSITIAELKFGVAKSTLVERNNEALDKFLAPLQILDFDNRAASCYGPLRASLEKIGSPLGPLDTLIAAHALSVGITLVTNNIGEFKRVKGLQIENWI